MVHSHGGVWDVQNDFLENDVCLPRHKLGDRCANNVPKRDNAYQCRTQFAVDRVKMTNKAREPQFKIMIKTTIATLGGLHKALIEVANRPILAEQYRMIIPSPLQIPTSLIRTAGRAIARS